MIPRLALLVLFALAAGACGDRPVAAPGAETDEPWGRTFLSTSVTEDGRERPLVAGTRIRLTFDGDGRRVSAHAGCNSMSGPAGISEGRLVVERLAATEMGCDPERHAQDQWLAALLTARPGLELDGTTLALRDGSTEVRLEDREVADPDRPLRATRWVVDTVIEAETASSVPPGAGAHLIFEPGDGRGFSGSTGCNAMFGTAEIGGDAIVFSGVGRTDTACEEERMRVERAVLATLDGRVAYSVEADVLRLDHPAGHGLRLRARD